PCPPRCSNCNRVGHLARDCRIRPANNNNNNNNNRNNNNRNNNNNNRNNNNNNQQGNGCFECGAQGYFKRNCPKLKNNDRGNQAGNDRAPAKVYAVGNAGANPDNVVAVNSASSNAYFSSVKEAKYQSEDPFGIYPLLNKDPKGVTVDVNSFLSHPPGFTPEGSKQENDHIVVPEEENVTYSVPDKENLSHVHPNFMQKAQVVSDNESNSGTHTFNHSHKAPSGGSILEILDGRFNLRNS
ncbi:putative reverse transcriptase domain-containing protein, partial [Tanacetum coccineum]